MIGSVTLNASTTKRMAEETTSVSAQEYRKATAYAAISRATDWKSIARRSETLCCIVFEREVMVFVTLPTEIASSLLTGWLKREDM